jgi:radical SAM protein with 4Fe4S-binding SPASM domain
MFFRLNPEARLISGAKNGVIYDFLGNDMYDLSPGERAVMELAEKSKEIEEISAYLGVPEASVTEICEKFREKNLGEFYEKKPYIEPLHLRPPLSGTFYDPPPQLTNFFVELNNSCEYDCSYCGRNEMKRVFGCIGCSVWDNQNPRLGSDTFMSVLDQAYKLGVGQIFLSGGNVLEDFNMLSAVLDYCEYLRFHAVFLSCHENHINSDAVHFLNRYRGLNVFLNCDFPVSSRALEIASRSECNLTLVPVVDVTDMSEEEVRDTIQHEHEKVQEKNIRWQIDYCSADFKKDYSKISLFGKDRVRNATLQFFERCQEYHPCLGGILTVSSDGDVYICRVMREKSLGSVVDTKLCEIMRNRKEEIKKFWHLTRDKITPCRDCEYRYSCMDCRAIEEDMYRTNLCGYDPYTDMEGR